MKEYIKILMKTMLFKGICPIDAEKFLECAKYKILHFKKNEIMLKNGNFNTKVYILLDGKINLYRIDFEGNCNIIESITSAQIFGASFACSGQKLSLSAVADSDCSVLVFDGEKLFNICNNSCDFHRVLVSNLIKIFSQKNILLNEKIQCLSKKTTKEKIMTYLFLVSQKIGENEFDIPFDRQQLADYLGVERSAMSVEISKLRKEKIIENNKNHFKILKDLSL